MWRYVWALLWICTTDLAAVGADSGEDASLLWGPYRSNLYFGVRPRIPNSLLFGLMWHNSDNFDGIRQLRHECTMEDSISSFGWSQFDSRLGGIQAINDQGNRVNLTIEFVKSIDGLSWAARVKGDQPKQSTLSLILSAGLEGDGEFQLGSKLTKKGIKGDVELVGRTPELGKFTLEYTEGIGQRPQSEHPAAAAHPPQLSQYTRLNVPTDNVWKAKHIFLALAQDSVNEAGIRFDQIKTTAVPPWAILTLDNSEKYQGRFHLVNKVFQGPFEFDILLNTQNSEDKIELTSVASRVEKLRTTLSEKLDFSANAAPFNKPAFQDFAKQLVSNVMGGIGYFYGDLLVGDPEDRKDVHAAPAAELFTCTPTRAFFPRGFYWDEGFHLLALINYDIDLVLEIVSSWFSLMDEDGWIAREQIRGPEARSRVPEEFQVGYPDYANPPTLIMLLAFLGEGHNERSLAKLKETYPDLVQHFHWFRSSQKGELLELDREPPSSKEAYRWRGRTPTHVLTSGMDDYPRASEPSDGELHVDLLSWVGAMAGALKKIATAIGKDTDAKSFSIVEDEVKRNLVAIHWNGEHGTFCDVTTDEFEEDVHVCHLGYVTILPYMLQLIDESETRQLLATLEHLNNPNELWSEFGIRSLSKSDKYFGTEENYWRGPVWINMNFLALEATKHYALGAEDSSVRDKASRVYHDLRINIVKNVFKVWKETGYVWEQYDGIRGNGRGAKQFTGWTALVANIMSMPESVGSYTGASGIHEEL